MRPMSKAAQVMLRSRVLRMLVASERCGQRCQSYGSAAGQKKAMRRQPPPALRDQQAYAR